MPFGVANPVPAVNTPYCSGAVPSGWPASACSAKLAVTPYHGSGTAPNSLKLVIQGMPFLLPSQNRERLGSLVAALQLFVITRSIDGPPERRMPCGRRALNDISNELYQRWRFGSLLSTFATALTFAALTL